MAVNKRLMTAAYIIVVVADPLAICQRQHHQFTWIPVQKSDKLKSFHRVKEGRVVVARD